VGHRGIVQVLDAGFVDGTTPYLVMERLLGENLKDRIIRRGGLRISQAAMALREIMKGLAAAHNKGIIHCDLKPENVFLSERRIERGSVKLLDFGIAQYAADASPPSDGEPAIYGTAEYMAPEQILAQEVDPRTDIYAAGAVIYEALTGAPPFSPDPPGTVFIRILRTLPAPLVGRREEIPPKFVELVMSMLAKAPADRPSNTQDVVNLIDDAGFIPRQSLSSSGLLVAVKKS
jgi:serine/threonine-protein kinase